MSPGHPLKGAQFQSKFSEDSQIETLVRNGNLVRGMPAFKRSRLSDQDLHDLIAYIRTLTPPGPKIKSKIN